MKVVLKFIFCFALFSSFLCPKNVFARLWTIKSGQWDALIKAVDESNLQPNRDTILLVANSIFDFADWQGKSNKNAFFVVAKGSQLSIFAQQSIFENKKHVDIAKNMFICEQEAILIVHQLYIKNADFKSDYTAFRMDNESRLELNKCKFEKNRVEKSGIICAQNAYIQCFQTEFKNNTTGSNGAAVCAENSRINLKKCHFIANIADGKASVGGAIYWVNGNSKINQLYIDGCVFTQNQATNKAGALALVYNSDDLTFSNQIMIKKTIFTENKTDSDDVHSNKGGACWIGSIGKSKNDNSTLQPIQILFIACTFYANQSALGGALYISNGQVRISNCELNDNQAGLAQENENGLGGGIYVAAGKIDIDASRISNNFAVHQGGGIYCKSTAKMRIFDTQIAYNKIGKNITLTDFQKSDGAIFRSANPSISDTLHIGNRSINQTAENNLLYSFDSH